MLVMLGMIAAFFLAIIVVLYVTLKKSRSFDDYAVAGRSFGPWYVAMSYVNSWWPGTVFISFAGITVTSGVFGFYGLAYATLGLAFMYFMATRAWRWGKKYNLVTQPDLMRLRYGSKAVGVIASVIGVIAILPWAVLGMQALATVFNLASGGTWPIVVCLLVGLGTVLVRQIWTVRMGMRGLVYTDMLQGIFAYVVAAIVCVWLLAAPDSPANWSNLSSLSESLLKVPGDGGTYGPLYMGCNILAGVLGAMCWPMSFVRIYTAKSVASVKKSTNYAILIAGGFYLLLTVVMLAATNMGDVVANPQAGWTTLLSDYGGVWLLGLGLVMIFAGSIGHIDGSIQCAGTQIANDIIGSKVDLDDRQKTWTSKACMVVFVIIAAIVAYFTNGMDRLQLLAQMSYSGIIQLSVPLFLGLFFKFGNKQGAIAGMVVGFAIAAGLTAVFPDDIPMLGSVTGGIVGLVVNLALYVVVSKLTKTSAVEKLRVEELFEVAAGHSAKAGAPVPEGAAAAVGTGSAAVPELSAVAGTSPAPVRDEDRGQGIGGLRGASALSAVPSSLPGWRPSGGKESAAV